MNNNIRFLHTLLSLLAHPGQTRNAFRQIALSLIALLALGLSSPAAYSQTYTEQTLASVGGKTQGTLLLVNGKFYGTTQTGGLGYGTIYSINPDGTGYQTLYQFTNTNGDGATPAAGLTAVNGTLYGTTQYGGADNSNSPYGNSDGTIFSIQTNGMGYRIIHTFTGISGDGANPQAGLLNVNGVLYGTTAYGGDPNAYYYGGGTVFSFHADGTGYQVIYQFTHAIGDGAFPSAALINVNGKLYGTTSEGGAHYNSGGFGTIYSVDLATQAVSILHIFPGDNGQALTNADGMYPDSDLILVNGLLYGTTSEGGITGTTGGPFNGLGTIFSFDPTTNAETTLYRFNGTDGKAPEIGLTLVNGLLYGSTVYGGSTGDGILFSLNPANNVESELLTFHNGGNYDGYPSGDFVNINGTLYATTAGGTLIAIAVPFFAANNDAYTDSYNTTLTAPAPGVLANDSIGDGTPFTATLVSNVTHGTLTFHSDGSFTYTPTAGYAGTDTFTYRDTTGNSLSNTATVTITVQPGVPIAANDSYAPQYQTPYVVKAPGVLANDNNGGTSATTARYSGYPAHGSLTFNSDGSFTYTPNSGFLGTDKFTYYAINSTGTSNLATVTLTVRAVAPVAHTDTYTTPYTTTLSVAAPGVLADDYPGDTGTITTALVSSPSHGTLTFHSDGSFQYLPDSGYLGTDSFTYQDTNAIGTSNVAPVNITVVPRLPIAGNDRYAPQYQTAYSVKAPGVLANDNNGGDPTTTATLVSAPTHGGLTFNSDGSFTYTPNSGFVGTDTFTYQAVNATGSSNVATVSLVVASMAPLAANDSYAPRYATAYAVKAPGVLANDNAEGGGTMTAALVSSPSNGSLTFNADGSFTYTPNSGFVGTDTFTYKDTTPSGTGNTATVTLTVQTSAPVAHNDAYTVAHNTTFTVHAPGVLANDYAGDSGSLIAIGASQPGHGTLTFNNDGSFTYTPNSGYSGTDSFIYYDSNAIGTSNIATVTLTVQ